MADVPEKPESTLVEEDDKTPAARRLPAGFNPEPSVAQPGPTEPVVRAFSDEPKSTVPMRSVGELEVPWPKDTSSAPTKTFEPLGGSGAPIAGTLDEPPTASGAAVIGPLEEPDTASEADAPPAPMPRPSASVPAGGRDTTRPGGPGAEARTQKAPPVPSREGERTTGMQSSFVPDATPRPSRPPLGDGAQGPRPSVPGQPRQTRGSHPVAGGAPADGSLGPRPSVPGQPRQTRSGHPVAGGAAPADGSQGPRPSVPGQPRQTRSGHPVARLPDDHSGSSALARPSAPEAPRPSREHRAMPRASAPQRPAPVPPPVPPSAADSAEVTPSDVKSTEMRKYGDIGRGAAAEAAGEAPQLSADATGEILDPRDLRPDASQTFTGFTEEQFRRALIALAAASALLVVLIVVWVFNLADVPNEPDPSAITAIPHAKGPLKREAAPAADAQKPVLVEQQVDAGNGETRTVLAAAGTVRIVTDPDTNVYIEGKDFGPQPVLVTLPAGKISVLLRNDKLGFRRTVSVDISPNERTAVRFVFTMGWIEIDAPPGSKAFVDGKATSGTHVQVWEGTHRVEVVHPDKKHTRAVQAVEVTGSMTTSVHFQAPSIADD